MILGMGTDIVNIERIGTMLEKFGSHFLEKNYTSAERKDMEACGDASRRRSAKAAKLFAAKEAAVKALGCGFALGVTHTDVEVSHDELGKPLLHLHGKARCRLDDLSQGKNCRLHLSLSDDFPFAQAVVIIEIL